MSVVNPYVSILVNISVDLEGTKLLNSVALVFEISLSQISLYFFVIKSSDA